MKKNVHMQKKFNIKTITNLVFMSVILCLSTSCVDLSGIHGQTALGNLKNVRNLIEKEGVPIDTVDDRGDSALHLAAYHGKKAIADYLINKGANINLQDNAGQTPLMLASIYNHRELAKLLIDSGANLELKKNNGYTALMLASYNDNHEIANILITAGSDVNGKTNAGETALGIARANKSYTTAKLLETSNADPGKAVKLANNTTPKTKPSHADGNTGSWKKLIPENCHEKDSQTISVDQNKALRYVIAEKEARRFKGNDNYYSNIDAICVEEIEIKDAFPLRGNLVVKYKALIMLRYGFRAYCLGYSKNGKPLKDLLTSKDVRTSASCMSMLGMPESKLLPGHMYYDEGEVTI